MISRKHLAAALGRLAVPFAAFFVSAPGVALANTCAVSDHLAAEIFVRDLHGYVSGKSGKNAITEAKLNAFVRAKVPVDSISRYALGIHWRRATDKQRTEYQKLFGETVSPDWRNR
jgi:ABC-type transporter MlaC component